MNNIFWGMILVSLDLKLSSANSALDLLPDFVGYLLIAVGTKALSADSDYFKKAHVFSIIMIVLGAVDWLCAGIGVYIPNTVPYIIISLIMIAASLAVVWLIIAGLGQVERETHAPLCSEKLWRSFWVLVVSEVATFVLSFFTALALAGLLVSVAAVIMLLYYFNRANKAYPVKK